MKIFILLFMVLRATPPGTTASLDFELIEQAKNIYLKYIIDEFNNHPIGDFYFDEGSLKGQKYHMSNPGSSNIKLTPGSQNSVIL